MPRQLKIAWFILAVAAATLLLFLIALPFVGPMVAQTAFVVSALNGFTPVLFRKDRRAPGVEFDERDNAINHKAAIFGFAASFYFVLLAFLACLGYVLLTGHDTIRIHILSLILWLAGTTVYVAHAVTTIILYRMQSANDIDTSANADAENAVAR